MNLQNLPLGEQIGEFGAGDPIFDVLMLIGPVIIGMIGIVGRTPLSRAIASGYLVFFVSYIIYKGR